jgi:hypothetical protein
MSVVAITSTMIVGILPTALKHARDAKRKYDLVQISRGLEAYYSLAGQYPTELPDCNTSLRFHDEVTLARTPCNPNSNLGYRYTVSEGGTNSWFKLYTNLEVTTDPVITKLHCLSGCGPACAYNYGATSSNTTLDNCAKTYVCAPGGGQLGSCEIYEDPQRSQCPEIFYDIPNCNNRCRNSKSRCKNASGKNVPN